MWSSTCVHVGLLATRLGSPQDDANNLRYSKYGRRGRVCVIDEPSPSGFTCTTSRGCLRYASTNHGLSGL